MSKYPRVLREKEICYKVQKHWTDGEKGRKMKKLSNGCKDFYQLFF